MSKEECEDYRHRRFYKYGCKKCFKRYGLDILHCEKCHKPVKVIYGRYYFVEKEQQKKIISSEIKENIWLKEQAIKIARHHKKHCEGKKCDISLLSLSRLLDKAGIRLTQKQLENFV